MTSTQRAHWRPPAPRQALLTLAACPAALLLARAALAHNVTEGDARYVQ